MSLPNVNPVSKLSSVLNKIIDNANANQLISSDDIIVTQTPNGTMLTLAGQHRDHPTAFLNPRGEYDPNNDYSINDMVIVEHDTNYVIDGEDTPVPADPGVWYCVHRVPAPALSNVLSDAGFSNSPLVRFAEVKYYPVWPRPEVLYEDVKDSTDEFARANIRYWEFISGHPKKARQCLPDGTFKNVYVDMFDSGSVST